MIWNQKVEKCLMLNRGRIVGLMHTWSIRCYGYWEERGVWWFSSFLQSGNEESQCGWCVVLSFTSVSFSLSQLEFWSVDYCLPSFDLTLLLRNLSFISFSEWIRLGFLCFLAWRSWIGWKITFNHFYFLTNFIYISQCTDHMCRNPFVPFWRKFQHR